MVYEDCSPIASRWIDVEEPQPREHRGETVGVVMLPPDESGAAFISHFKHDAEMAAALRDASGILAALVRRLTRATLRTVAPALVDDPLAAVADYEV